MMKVAELINTIKASVPFNYYANQFPASQKGDIAYVRLTGGGVANKNVQRPSFVVVVRTESPAKAEQIAYDILNTFNSRSNFLVGDKRVIYCSASTSTPLFLGEDENGRTLYSINFITITEGV
jgi:hypothetical protein